MAGVPSGCGASAGVAEWQPEQTPAALIDQADRALLHGKQHRGRGSVVVYSALPAGLRPVPTPPSPVGIQAAVAPLAAVEAAWPDQGREQTERLRVRTRQLALANAMGARLSAMTDPEEIIGAAVDELNRAFGYFLCAIVRIREDNYVEAVAWRGTAVPPGNGPGLAMPRAAGVIGRCLRERQPVIVGDVRDEPDYVAKPATADVRSELVVPLWVGDELWGAIDIEEERPNAFDEDDARLVQTVAGQVGSALRSATLYERLDGAYIGTAQALATAIEAGDRERGASSAVIELATAVGHRLDMGQDDIRSLRLAAIFHDIGKVSLSDEVLNKRGPLTETERLQIERHTVVGESILSSVEFLEDVRPLVRHAHERWDGAGYPDGLCGEADSARRPHRPCLRRLRRDDRRASLPRVALRGRRARTAERRLRQPVRSERRHRAARGARRSGNGLGQDRNGVRGDRLDLRGGAVELLVGEHGRALEREVAVQLDPGAAAVVLGADLDRHRARDAVGAQQDHVHRVMTLPFEPLFGVVGRPHVVRATERRRHADR